MSVRIFMLAVGVFATTITWAAGGVVQSPTGVAPDRYVYYPGTVPDPISDFIKAGRWQPAEEAQAPMVDEFKKDNNLK